MISTHQILSSMSAGISDLKKNPMEVIKQGKGAAVAILNRNRPVFYAVPADMYEQLLEQVEDAELAALAKQRMDSPEIEVALDEL